MISSFRSVGVLSFKMKHGYMLLNASDNCDKIISETYKSAMENVCAMFRRPSPSFLCFRFRQVNCLFVSLHKARRRMPKEEAHLFDKSETERKSKGKGRG